MRRRGVHSGGSRRSSSVLNRVEHPAADLSGIHLEDLDAVVLCGSGGSGGAERFFLDEARGGGGLVVWQGAIALRENGFSRERLDQTAHDGLACAMRRWPNAEC